MRLICFLLTVMLFSSCSGGDAGDLVDIVDGIPRRTIDTSRLGVNAFANDSRFGSITEQYQEVRDVLGLRFVRVLFAWDDSVQPTPGSVPNFSFYDNVVNALPSGVDALVVVTGVPSWMSDSINWQGGDPRATFVDLWVKKVASRYRDKRRIVGYQIWNEPNMETNPQNSTLNLLNSPANYVEMLARAYSVIKDVSSGKLVVNATTTSIQQNHPDTLNYNRGMRDAGVLQFSDVFAFHYYGRQFEKFLLEDDVKGFLNSLGVTLWVTESGIQGVTEQLGYGEQVWPFLREHLPTLDRLYVYQFTEATPAGSSFGLRTLDPQGLYSDLYMHLSERNQNGS